MAENRTLKWGSSPPEHIVRVHAISKWLKFSHLRHREFYVNNVINIFFSLFATHRSHFRSSQRRKVTTKVKSCHGQPGSFCPFCASQLTGRLAGTTAGLYWVPTASSFQSSPWPLRWVATYGWDWRTAYGSDQRAGNQQCRSSASRPADYRVSRIRSRNASRCM
jgi:hypothetical protein